MFVEYIHHYYFENIILQCNHLKKNITFEKNPSKRLEILTALIMSGLVFKDYDENYKIAIKELEKAFGSFEAGTFQATLEEIAKTLFKSWFIDFDPVRAKAEGRPTGLSKEISDLFPDCISPPDTPASTNTGKTISSEDSSVIAT